MNAPDRAVARYLREIGHTVFSVYELARGLKDAEIMLKAFQEDWIIIHQSAGLARKIGGGSKPAFRHESIV